MTTHSHFRISDGKGFQMLFANGWTISVQFGKMNYCQNRHSTESNVKLGEKGSNTAEVLIWNNLGNVVDYPLSSASWAYADEVAKIITWTVAQMEAL